MTWITCLKRLACLFSWVVVAPVVFAESRALIVTGLSGSAANEEEFTRLAGETRRLLFERGFSMEKIEVLGGKTSRETILAKLGEAKTLLPEDEFWLVLYGHSGRSQGNLPAFQISGPRLTATDLQTALDSVPARQFVLIGSSASGDFLPLLQNARRSVISATKAGAENDQPRFPSLWVKAFSENPKAAFPAIAARAAALVTEEYQTSQLAQTEHARLADPVTGTILEPPFGVDLAAAPEHTAGNSPVNDSLLNASEIEIKVKDPKAEWETQPANDETRRLIAAAKAEPNPEGHAALVIEQRIGFTVEEDRSTEHLTFQRVYLAREEAVEEWANRFLPQSPPAVTTKLQVARVIQPDGSSIVYNPAKLNAATDPDSGETSSAAMVYLPNAHAGCLVEIGWRTHEILNASLPYVSEAIPIQSAWPALKTQIEVRLPVKPLHRATLPNQTVAPVETLENGRRVLRWDLPKLAAAESLPGDPPFPQWAVWLGVSSLPSWDDFALWYRRIAQGSDVIDDAVRKTAAELTKTSATREEKVRRCYEFVAAFRYVAIELGVQGFRPRTPAQVLANRYGDCKDKANLLVALLKCQGLDARFVLLNRGGTTDVNFPSWQFNHAIAYLPAAAREGQAEDLWMDTTDSVTPLGFVAPGDFGRAGLVFSGNKTEFKTILDPKANVSRIEDLFQLQPAEKGWQGTFRRTAKGQAEDEMRRIFRGLTPQQRNLRAYRLLQPLWPNADFAEPGVSDVSSLQESASLGAKAVSYDHALPLADFPWLNLLTAPVRDRPLLINDGQPCAGVQTLRLRSEGSATLPENWSAQPNGAKFSVNWRRVDATTIERIATVEFPNSTVAPADYVAVRAALRQWQRQQSESFQTTTP